MQDLLYKLERERWNWAKQGVEEFRNGFLRLQETNPEKKRVLIGVYGPTQVGKTTLILKVLGIAEDKMNILSKALRGKRSAGHSATVTSTIYQRSSSDFFVLVYPEGSEKRCDTLSELEDALYDVRVKVEENDIFSTKPLIIKIANTFFNERELMKRKQDIEIIDLPGDDSREVKEIRHVNRCLKEYLPLCRVCILMEISSQLVSLTQLDREFVRDWKWMPSQFRIVLTRAVTSSSVIRLIKNEAFTSTTQFQRFFESELDRYATEDEQIATKVYPLEFGDSWDGIKKQDVELYNRTKPWIDETMAQLVEDLSSVHSPQSEIEQVKDLERYAIKRSKEEFEALARKKAQHLDKLQDVERSIKLRSRKKVQAVDELDEFIEQGKEIEKERLTKPVAAKLRRWKYRSLSEKKTTVLKNDFYFYLDNLKEEYQDRIESWNRKVKTFVQHHGLKTDPITLEFKEKSASFLDNHYIMKTYLRKGNFNEDCEILDRKLLEANDESYATVATAIETQKDKLVKDVNSLIYRRNALIQTIDEEIMNEKKEIQRLEQSLVEIKKLMKTARHEWNLDIERSKKFNEFLKNAFVIEAKRLQQLIVATHTRSEEKWLYHQYLNIIYSDVERITKNV
ncbi:V-type ATP synthase subunit I domain-containing protein [Bacillus solitudinis]|uniref:hypothetical protein n=1 Tax=Bacillus solitudinis TaxID=2014074 RepID=UPI000C249F4A|nr:hypothetical protein [Bacillus solitudinis]